MKAKTVITLSLILLPIVAGLVLVIFVPFSTIVSTAKQAAAPVIKVFTGPIGDPDRLPQTIQPSRVRPQSTAPVKPTDVVAPKSEFSMAALLDVLQRSLGALSTVVGITLGVRQLRKKPTDPALETAGSGKKKSRSKK